MYRILCETKGRYEKQRKLAVAPVSPMFEGDDSDMDGAFCKLRLSASLCVAQLLLTERILLPQNRTASLPPLMATKGLHPRRVPKHLKKHRLKLNLLLLRTAALTTTSLSTSTDAVVRATAASPREPVRQRS